MITVDRYMWQFSISHTFHTDEMFLFFPCVLQPIRHIHFARLMEIEWNRERKRKLFSIIPLNFSDGNGKNDVEHAQIPYHDEGLNRGDACHDEGLDCDACHKGHDDRNGQDVRDDPNVQNAPNDVNVEK
uniref:Uncharacterized protein n=1 Tax=Mayetiola destructor TaxID=39758 RepID=F6KPR4_MAYDE|nr:hypothetical protein [Mayetiola destructor]